MPSNFKLEPRQGDTAEPGFRVKTLETLGDK